MAEKENLHKDHRKRMMNRYIENGIDSFEKHEILEMLLFNVFTRCNTNDISHRLLKEFKSINGVLNAAAADLTAIEGIGSNAATHICFLGDLYRYLALENPETVVLDSNERVFEFCKELVNISATEFFLLLLVDKKRTLLSKYYVTGNFHSVQINKRDISAKAIQCGCDCAIAVHNHLEEELRPSSADVSATSNLRLFLKSIQIELLDHLILNKNGYCSMKKEPSCHSLWLV